MLLHELPLQTGFDAQAVMEAFSRSDFSQRFLNICKQLDALQPVANQGRSLANDKDLGDTSASSSSGSHRSLMLPTRDRMYEILVSNERFRPSEEMVSVNKDRASPATPSRSLMMSPNVPLSGGPRTSVLPDALESRTSGGAKDGKLQQQQANAVHVPVGGKARVIPSQSLLRFVRFSPLQRCQSRTSSGYSLDRFCCVE